MDKLKNDQNNQSTESIEENPFISLIRKFQSYWKTRKAVQKGEPLYDFTRTQLRERNFLGPWTFNLYEIFLSSIPTIIIFKIISIFFSTPEAIKQVDRISAWVDPIMIPLGLTIIANIVARGSLKRKDINSRKLVRAKHAYLYIDGAYGVLSQALMVFGYTLKAYLDLGFFNSYAVMYLIAYALIVVGGLHQFYISWYTVPQRLFALNGYISVPDHKKDAPSNSAPYRRFGKVVFYGGAGVILLFYIAYVVVGIIILRIFSG